MNFPAGQSVSHYRILEKLGEGGMGVVYKGHDTLLDRTVALKFLPHYLTSDPSERDRFRHEARAAAALTHANIAVVYEICEHEGEAFIVMEYVEGKTLREVLKGEPLSIKQVLDLCIQVGDGLAAAHEKGIVHRDIKPENIIIAPKGQAKITDFGLAKLKGASKLTKAGSTLGTAAYMSPEQAEGEEVDQRTDIFSFGVLLYELLAGRPPFRGEHQAALIYSIVNEEPLPIARFNEKVSPELEHLVAKALAKDKDERYQHVDDLLADLRHERKKLEYAKAGYATSAAILPPKPSRRRSSLSIGIAVAAVIALIVLALIFNPFNLKIGVQQNLAGQEQSLAVISFENIPDPADKDYTGEMLSNLVTTALFETRGLDVISRERLFEIQKDIGQGETKAISPATASQIARRAGVSKMLLGSVLQIHPLLTVTYRVIDVETGRIVSTRRATGFATEKLFALADTLALMVKNDLNVAAASPAPSRSVMEVTTKSPEAYRAYVEAMVWLNRAQFHEATVAFKKAIELDSTFAMAYCYLGWMAEADAMRKAWDLRENLPEKERWQIEAHHADLSENNPAKSAEILEQLLRKYPHEQLVYADLALTYSGSLDAYDRALDVCRRGLAVDPSDKMLWNQLSYLYAGFGNRAEALDAVDSYLRLAPTEPNPYDSKGDIFMALGEPDSAFAWWKKGLAFGIDFSSGKLAYQSLVRRNHTEMLDYVQKYGRTGNSEQKARAEVAAALIPLHKGELGEASKQLSAHLEYCRKERAPSQALITTELHMLILTAYEQADYMSMLRYSNERVKEQRRRVGASPVYGRGEVAWALTKLGRNKEASRLLDDIRRELPPALPKAIAEYDYYTGLCALERGQAAAAAEQMKNSFRKLQPNRTPDYFYGVALLRSGKIGEALKEFLQLTWRSPIDDTGAITPTFSPSYRYWPVASVKAHYWLGVAYQEQGDKENAVKEYTTFLDIWQNADFKSPEMQDARDRLAKLH